MLHMYMDNAPFRQDVFCLLDTDFMILGCTDVKDINICQLTYLNGYTFILYCTSGQVFLTLHDRTAAGCGIVISVHFKLISIHIINIRLSFPPVVHFGYGNELDRLPLL